MTSCKAFWRGQVDYCQSSEEMLAFTDARTAQTDDEIWLLEHPPVYTQGTSCQTLPKHNPAQIPVVKSSRGGQITYHGPGQLIAYLLFDIKRLGFGPRRLVQTIEQSVIDLMAGYGLQAKRRKGAPGVYIDGNKIAALGLRIRNGKCFHGLSINVDMDLAPFEFIDPCGIENLVVTQLSDCGVERTLSQVADDVLLQLQSQFDWQSDLRSGLPGLQCRPSAPL